MEYSPFEFEISSYGIRSFNINSDTYRLILVVDGSIELTAQDEKIILKKDDVEIINPNNAYIINPLDANLIIELSLNQEIFLSNKLDEENLYFKILNGKDMDAKIKISELCKKLFYLYARDHVASVNLFVAILNEIHDTLSVKFSFKNNGVSYSVPSWLGEKTVDLMKKMYLNPKQYFLNDLAEEFGMKASNFSNLFKSVSGIGFVDFNHNIRLEKSISLLTNKEYSISTIGEISGFSNSKTLSESYKKYIGMTPTLLRKKMIFSTNKYAKMPLEKILKLPVFVEVFEKYRRNSIFEDDEINLSKEKVFMVDSNAEATILSRDFNKVVDIDLLEGTDMNFHIAKDYKINHKYLRVNMCFEDGKAYIIQDVGDKERLDLHKVNYYVQQLESMGINIMLAVKFSDTVIDAMIGNLFNMHSNDPNLDAFVYILDSITSNVTRGNVNQWMLELDMPSLWKEKHGSNRYHMNKRLYRYIRDKIISRSAISDIGINLGDASVVDDPNILTTMEDIVMYLGNVSFISYDVFDETIFTPNPDIKCILIRIIEQMDRMSKYVENLSNKYSVELDIYISRMFMYYDWNSIPKKYWESIQALSLISSFLVYQANRVVVCTAFSYGRFFDSKDDFIRQMNNFDVKYLSKNMWNIKTLNYYIKLCLDSLKYRCVFNEHNLIVTRDDNDYSCIVYQDMATCIKYVTTENEAPFSTKKFRVKISGIYGRYKLIAKTIRSSKGTFYSELEKLGASGNLTIEEIEYLKCKTIPDIYVEDMDLYGEFDKTFSLDLFEITYFELRKLNNSKKI